MSLCSSGSAVARRPLRHACHRSDGCDRAAAPEVPSRPKAPLAAAEPRVSVAESLRSVQGQAGARARPPTDVSVLPPPGQRGRPLSHRSFGLRLPRLPRVAAALELEGRGDARGLGTVSMIQKVVNDRRPTMLAVAMDCRGPSFRKEIDARYKATRQAAPAGPLGPDGALRADSRRPTTSRSYQSDGIEADDLIAAVVERAVAEGVRVVIVSADKDLMQLVRDRRRSRPHVGLDAGQDVRRAGGRGEVRRPAEPAPRSARAHRRHVGQHPGRPERRAEDRRRSAQGVQDDRRRLREPRVDQAREAEGDARASTRRTRASRRCSSRSSATSTSTGTRRALRYGGANVEELRRLFIELELTRLLDQMTAAQARLDAGQRANVGDKGAGRAVAMVAAAARSHRSAAAPAITRTYRHVLDEAGLAAVVARAKREGRVAVHIATTSPDPMRARIHGIALSVTPGEGIYVPIEHRYLGAPVAAHVGEDPRARRAAVRRRVGTQGRLRPQALGEHPRASRRLAGRPHLGPDARGVPARSRGAERPEGPRSPGARDGAPDLRRRHRKKGRSRRVRSARRRARDDLRGACGGARAGALGAARSRASRTTASASSTTTSSCRSRACSRRWSARACSSTRASSPPSRRASRRSARALEAKAQELAGRKFAIRSRDQLEAILFDELQLAGRQAHAQGRALDRRRRARGARRQARAARGHPRVPRARQAEGDVPRRAARAR